MKKCISFLLLICASLVCANEQEERGQELCDFTENVFNILQDKEGLETPCAPLIIENLIKYTENPNPEIVALAKKFINSFTSESDSKGTLADAISDLGRLLKCSVDDECYRTDTSYILHRQDLNKQIFHIESKLGDRLPQGRVNYHKLMIESLADEEYDMALYAYIKIATNRCKHVINRT